MGRLRVVLWATALVLAVVHAADYHIKRKQEGDNLADLIRDSSAHTLTSDSSLYAHEVDLTAVVAELSATVANLQQELSSLKAAATTPPTTPTATLKTTRPPTNNDDVITHTHDGTSESFSVSSYSAANSSVAGPAPRVAECHSPCTLNTDCDDADHGCTNCRMGRCQPDGYCGDYCMDDTDCYGAHCTGSCIDSMCQNPTNDTICGSPCNHDTDCAGGVAACKQCTNGFCQNVTFSKCLPRNWTEPIRSVGYSPAPVGDNPMTMAPYGDYFTYDYRHLYERDLPLIKNMGANTIRLWWWDISANHSHFLNYAHELELKVIATFPLLVPSYEELHKESFQQKVRADFVTMIENHKDFPAILYWLVGNELNTATYGPNGTSCCTDLLMGLVEDLVQLAHIIEGNATCHPVSTPLADIDDLQEVIRTYTVDIWSVQLYRGCYSFTSFWDDYYASILYLQQNGVIPDHYIPRVVVSEFGVDAYDDITGEEYPATQSLCATTLYQQIETYSNLSYGGSLMEWSDEWWKGINLPGSCQHPDCGVTNINNTAFRHSLCGFPDTSSPDFFKNEEYWGVMRYNDHDPLCMEMREVYRGLRGLWLPDANDTVSCVDSSTGANHCCVDKQVWPDLDHKKSGPSTCPALKVRNVTVVGRKLYIDYKPAQVKGVYYSPVPIGDDPQLQSPYGDYFTSSSRNLFNRDLPLIASMGANAVVVQLGTSQRHTEFLDAALKHNIDVIVSFFIPVTTSFNNQTRDDLVYDFEELVRFHYNHPAVIMWLVSGPVNIVFEASIDEVFYLVAALRSSLTKVEGPNRHPLAVGMGDAINLWPSISRYDNIVDLWQIEMFHGKSFYNLFQKFYLESNRPLLTMFGMGAYVSTTNPPSLDALPRGLKLGEALQEEFISNLWVETAANVEVCVGGVLMEWNDEWWRGDTAESGGVDCTLTHDRHNVACGQLDTYLPDGFLHSQYLGVMTQSLEAAADCVSPRAAYWALRCRWTGECLNGTSKELCGKGGEFDCCAAKLETPLLYVYLSIAFPSVMLALGVPLYCLCKRAVKPLHTPFYKNIPEYTNREEDEAAVNGGGGSPETRDSCQGETYETFRAYVIDLVTDLLGDRIADTAHLYVEKVANDSVPRGPLYGQGPQVTHMVELLTHELIRRGVASKIALNKAAITVKELLLEGYFAWCNYVKAIPRADTTAEDLEACLFAIFDWLIMWELAGNGRHCPEALCCYYHHRQSVPPNSVAGSTQANTRGSTSIQNGADSAGKAETERGGDGGDGGGGHEPDPNLSTGAQYWNNLSVELQNLDKDIRKCFSDSKKFNIPEFNYDDMNELYWQSDQVPPPFPRNKTFPERGGLFFGVLSNFWFVIHFKIVFFVGYMIIMDVFIPFTFASLCDVVAATDAVFCMIGTFLHFGMLWGALLRTFRDSKFRFAVEIVRFFLAAGALASTQVSFINIAMGVNLNFGIEDCDDGSITLNFAFIYLCIRFLMLLLDVGYSGIPTAVSGRKENYSQPCRVRLKRTAVELPFWLVALGLEFVFVWRWVEPNTIPAVMYLCTSDSLTSDSVLANTNSVIACWAPRAAIIFASLLGYLVYTYVVYVFLSSLIGVTSASFYKRLGVYQSWADMRHTVNVRSLLAALLPPGVSCEEEAAEVYVGDDTHSVYTDHDATPDMATLAIAVPGAGVGDTAGPSGESTLGGGGGGDDVDDETAPLINDGETVTKDNEHGDAPTSELLGGKFVPPVSGLHPGGRRVGGSGTGGSDTGGGESEHGTEVSVDDDVMEGEDDDNIVIVRPQWNYDYGDWPRVISGQSFDYDVPYRDAAHILFCRIVASMYNDDILAQGEARDLRKSFERYNGRIGVRPRSAEARRRMLFFMSSLAASKNFYAIDIETMPSFTVLIPVYNETIIFTSAQLRERSFTDARGSGTDYRVSDIEYLVACFPDEWQNFHARMKIRHGADDDSFPKDPQVMLVAFVSDAGLPEALEVDIRIWASYRGQTLARTVKGAFEYIHAMRALLLTHPDYAIGPDTPFRDRKIKLIEDLVASKCQVLVTYQTFNTAPEATKEAMRILREEFPGLEVTYLIENKPFFGSALEKGVINDRGETVFQREYEVWRYGPMRIGQGKAENQNHAMVFVRGECMQTIDMNQEHYFEEALKVPFLLHKLFRKKDGKRVTAYRIVGFREYPFTERLGTVGRYMGSAEMTFGTIVQRVLAFLGVRLHYGHPDFWDGFWAKTRGISKSSTLNVSEDIFAGYEITLRGDAITHKEFIQVGKGRETAFPSSTVFESKLASGAGLQCMSRDVYRLNRNLPLLRRMSLLYGSLGFYLNNSIMTYSIWMFMYAILLLSLSGHTAHQIGTLGSALAVEWFIQLGYVYTFPLMAQLVVENGVGKGLILFLRDLPLSTLFWVFHMRTKTYFFANAVKRSAGSWLNTGRGFGLRRQSLRDAYCMYGESHFHFGLQLLSFLTLYYIYDTQIPLEKFLKTWTIVLTILAWLFSPTIFNPFTTLTTMNKELSDFLTWLQKHPTNNEMRRFAVIDVSKEEAQEQARINTARKKRKNAGWAHWWFNRYLDDWAPPHATPLWSWRIRQLVNMLVRTIPWVVLAGALMIDQDYTPVMYLLALAIQIILMDVVVSLPVWHGERFKSDTGVLRTLFYIGVFVFLVVTLPSARPNFRHVVVFVMITFLAIEAGLIVSESFLQLYRFLTKSKANEQPGYTVLRLALESQVVCFLYKAVALFMCLLAYAMGLFLAAIPGLHTTMLYNESVARAWTNLLHENPYRTDKVKRVAFKEPPRPPRRLGSAYPGKRKPRTHSEGVAMFKTMPAQQFNVEMRAPV